MMTSQNQRNLFFNMAVVGVALISPVTMALCGLGQTVNVDATVAAGVAATQQAVLNLQATVDAAIAATQAANPPPIQPVISTPAPNPLPVTPVPANLPTDPEQVRAVILTEVNATVAKDLTLLKSLYTPDAVVIDRNGTPAMPVMIPPGRAGPISNGAIKPSFPAMLLR